MKYHRNQDVLNKKKVQAGLRNPEEFYHKMITISKGTEKTDKIDVHSSKNLLNFHMQKLNKSERKNEDSYIHEYAGKHTILIDDEEEMEKPGFFFEKSTKTTYLSSSKSEPKVKIATEERRLVNSKKSIIEQKMNEMSGSNLSKKVKKLRTRLR